MNRDDNVDRMHSHEEMTKLQPERARALPVKWADRAQYHSATMPEETRAPGGGSRPTVTLLNATPDPLGSLAALCGIYEGKVVRALQDVTDDDRRSAWEAMRATVLNGPLEAIQFHFLVEGVTRAFTHQAVRNRFSFFAQESMRFAVVDNEEWTDRQAYPPSIGAMDAERVWDPEAGCWDDEYRAKAVWDGAIQAAQEAYVSLVNAGIPAEDARGLMPHAITTRYHWVVSVRTLLGEAGKRLCTQAEFPWRVVMSQVAKSLRSEATRPYAAIERDGEEVARVPRPDGWQFELMADALAPVCYQTGNCGFMAKFDRGCTIRPRVEAHAAKGTPSSEWHDINPIEWLADPGAART